MHIVHSSTQRWSFVKRELLFSRLMLQMYTCLLPRRGSTPNKITLAQQGQHHRVHESVRVREWMLNRETLWGVREIASVALSAEQ